MKVILSNDDGINAPGIQALIECMPEGLDVTVVAPMSEKSACSHAISLGQKLYVHDQSENGIKKFAVEGTPADCIKFAISELEGDYPDMIVSGINQGANTGCSVYYSGTISAAREGFINRIPAIAISLCDRSRRDFRATQDITKKLVEGYRDQKFPTNVMLNVNVPALDQDKIKGVKMTKQATSRFIEEFILENDEAEDKKAYTLAGEIEIFNPDGSSDEEAVAEGYISITPLKLDLTDYDAMNAFKEWAKKKS